MKMRMIDVIKKSSDRDVAQIIGAVVAMRADGLSEEEAINIEYRELLRVLQVEVEVDYKPTNADRIRGMSDEELADLFDRIIRAGESRSALICEDYRLGCAFACKKDRMCEKYDGKKSYDSVLDWLHSEVE